jgi:hypothetical protein
MQSNSTDWAEGSEFFKTIPFSLVYHDGPYDNITGIDIRRCRCAEVLAPSPLSLKGSLVQILCRSSAERSMLLHLIGPEYREWSDLITVCTAPGIFEGRFSHVNSFDTSSAGVTFTLNHRFDGADVQTRVEVLDHHSRPIISTPNKMLSPRHNWLVKKAIAPGEYLARVELEGCRAYEAQFSIDDLPF